MRLLIPPRHWLPLAASVIAPTIKISAWFSEVFSRIKFKVVLFYSPSLFNTVCLPSALMITFRAPHLKLTCRVSRFLRSVPSFNENYAYAWFFRGICRNIIIRTALLGSGSRLLSRRRRRGVESRGQAEMSVVITTRRNLLWLPVIEVFLRFPKKAAP